MATLTESNARAMVQGEVGDFPMIAADTIYAGAAVGDNGSGYARPLQAGDVFLGFALEDAANESGAAGDVSVRVQKRGIAVLNVASLAITDFGKDVFASDDDTFVLTQGSNTPIGHVVGFDAAGVGIVRFGEGGGVVPALTDNSGGTASDTIAAIGATYDQAEVRNAVASLAAKVNLLLAKS